MATAKSQGPGRVMSGWLDKEGSWNTAWKSRYCILDTEKQITYYADDKLTDRKGVVDLKNMKNHCERKDPSKMEHGFEVICPSRTWFFKTTNRKESQEWIDAISRVTSQDQRNIRLNWQAKDKVQVFSKSKNDWVLGYIKRLERHVVCVAYEDEKTGESIQKELRIFDAFIRAPTEDALRKDKEKKEKKAEELNKKKAAEEKKKKEEEEQKQKQAEEESRKVVEEERAKNNAKNEEAMKIKEEETSKQAKVTSGGGTAPATETQDRGYEGMKVVAYWRDSKNEAHNGWYGATIETINADGTYNVLFNDGHRQMNKPHTDIEELKDLKPLKAAGGAGTVNLPEAYTVTIEAKPLNLKYRKDNGIVYEVNASGNAANAGVKAGCTIIAIDGTTVEAGTWLDVMKKTNVPFQMTCLPCIRKEVNVHTFPLGLSYHRHLVQKVEKGSHAEDLGIKVNDVIFSIDGEEHHLSKFADAFTKRIGDAEGFDMVVLEAQKPKSKTDL